MQVWPDGGAHTLEVCRQALVVGGVYKYWGVCTVGGSFEGICRIMNVNIHTQGTYR